MRYLIALLCTLLLSCTKPHQKESEIIKVQLARSGAWSDYGATISIDTSLNYMYYGDYGNIKQGYFVGRVDGKFWDTLTQKLEQLKYKTIPVTDNKFAVDVNFFELIVHWKNGERGITRIEKYPPDSLFNVIKWIDTSYRIVKLHQVKYAIKFEISYHRKPIHIIDQVKFPPPIYKNKRPNAK